MARAQSSIQAFGRISKSHHEPAAVNKRKASPDERDEILYAPKHRKKLRIKAPQTPIDTPTKAISRKLAGLELASHSSSPIAASKHKSRIISPSTPFRDTPPTSPCPSPEQTKALPDELQDLTALNAAFLHSIALYYAHHATTSLCDVVQLTPSIEKLWGKRRVKQVDLRRCMGLMQKSQRSIPFELVSYGHGMICFELQRGTRFNQEKQAKIFEQRLQEAWERYCASTWDEEDVLTFIEQLPQAVVTLTPNSFKSAQAFERERGQKRLEEVLGSRDEDDSIRKPSKRRRLQGADTSERKPTQKPQVPAVVISTPNADSAIAATTTAASRGTSLLSRILQKQSLASTLPAAPTKGQAARLAALQRVEEISAILDLLVAAKGQGPRTSFPLANLVQSVQGSIRSPMGKTEVESVLKVMEEEGVAGLGYVKMLKMGSMEGVVVDMGRKVGREECRNRIRDALARM